MVWLEKHELVLLPDNILNFFNCSIYVLRESVTRFLSVGFLHQMAPPGPLRGTLGQFSFLPKICEDIQI